MDEQQSCCKRTPLECTLIIILTLILTIVTAGLLLKFTVFKSDPICTSADCVLVAADLLKQMDRTVDPCFDFFNFVCGKALTNDKKPLVELIELVETQFEAIIEEPIEESDEKPLKVLKKYFQTCENMPRIEENGMFVMKHILNTLGGWPVVLGHNWTEKFDWKQNMVRMRKIGVDFEFFLRVDLLAEGDKNFLIITEPSQKFPFGEFTSNYQNLIEKVAVAFGAHSKRASKDAQNLIEFERNLTMLVNETKKVPGKIQMIKLGDLEKYQFFLNYTKFINDLINANAYEHPIAAITENEFVVYQSWDYFHHLQNLLAKTSKRVQANYILWKVVWEYLPFISKTMRELKSNVTGETASCKETGKNLLPNVAEIAYGKKYLPEADRTPIREMVNNIKEVFLGVLNESDWMDNDTKSFAMEKLISVQDYVGYPGGEASLNDALNYVNFEEIEVNLDNHILVLNEIRKRKQDALYRTLRKPLDKSLDPLLQAIKSVEPFNFINLNAILLPTGMLQGLFYNKNWANYLNYGALGTFIGHELTHGFATLGKDRGILGEPHSWWTENTEYNFWNKTECLQLENKTLEETLCDYNGLNLANLAYKRWISSNGKEARLPGLDFTPDQLFWISFASPLCYEIVDGRIGSLYADDSHPFPNLIVLGSTSNNRQFAHDFNCPLNSPMNPETKCQIF